MITNTDEHTYLFFDGCDQFLGCTICLSGPDKEELIKVKHFHLEFALSLLIKITREERVQIKHSASESHKKSQ